MSNWIFLRGLTRESRHWGNFIEQFQQTLHGGRVVALDLPGNGYLNQQPSPVRVQDMVEHCRAELALRHMAPPYQVLAMSLGAMVAVAWASAYPQEISANVLISTSMRPFSSFYQRLRPANYGALLKLLVGCATPEVWERTVLRITANHPHDDVLPLWLALRFSDVASEEHSLAPCYINRDTLLGSIWRTLSAPPLCAILTFGEPQSAQGRDRRAWALDLHAEVENLRAGCTNLQCLVSAGSE